MTIKELRVIIACGTIGIGMFRFEQLTGQVVEKWQPVPSHELSPEPIINEARGNWYYKREYYRKARQLYDTIRKRVEDLDGLKEPFLQKKARIDNELTDFSAKLGFQEGEINQALLDLEKELSEERKKMIELTEKERSSEEQVKEKRHLLEQLKENLATVGELRGALDKSIKAVLQTIDQGHAYGERAWKNFTQISTEINDRKAEQLYLAMESYLTNINAGARYLTGQLTTFFDTQINQLHKLMQEVRQGVSSLRARGIELSKQIAAEQKADLERKLKKKLEEEERERKEAQARNTWWYLFKESMSSLWGSIRDFVTRPFVKEAPKKATKAAAQPVTKTPTPTTTHAPVRLDEARTQPPVSGALHPWLGKMPK